MKRRPDTTASLRLHEQVWALLVPLFRVPEEPPSLPVGAEEALRVFHPAPAYLRYQKLRLLLLMTAVDVPLLGLSVWITTRIWWLGLLLAPLFLVVIVVPDLVAWVAIHLRYETMWYAMSGRSLRIRHGIWTIQEKTLTFENVQNVNLRQGPLERCFGIARVIVRTAGGGGTGQGGESAGHRGLIEGADNAAEIRDLIAQRLHGDAASAQADRRRAAATGAWSWTPPHLEALRALRDRLAALPEGGAGRGG